MKHKFLEDRGEADSIELVVDETAQISECDDMAYFDSVSSLDSLEVYFDAPCSLHASISSFVSSLMDISSNRI